MTLELNPVEFRWDAESECMVPEARFIRIANRQYVDGEIYRLVVDEERSPKSHAHYFASVANAWKNLPPPHDERFPSPTHLRKWALCKAGYCDTVEIPVARKQDIPELIAIFRRYDRYCVIVPKERAIQISTAHSQRVRKMDAKTFQESKTKVLDIISVLIGTDAATLQRNTQVEQ